MLAVIETGGKQYLVEKGNKIEIEIMEEVKEGATIEFKDVLLTTDGKTTKVGAPFVEGAVVTGKLLKQFKDEKVTTFKMSRKKRYKKTKGHRQPLLSVEIMEIKA